MLALRSGKKVGAANELTFDSASYFLSTDCHCESFWWLKHDVNIFTQAPIKKLAQTMF